MTIRHRIEAEGRAFSGTEPGAQDLTEKDVISTMYKEDRVRAAKVIIRSADQDLLLMTKRRKAGPRKRKVC